MTAFNDSGDSMASVQASDQGENSQIPITRLDTFMQKHPGEKVSWIKADLEGYAGEMIRGSEATICRDRPLLTLGVYHCPDEFFEIPKMLKRFVPEYRFFLRCCQCIPAPTYNEITLIACIP